ncbi:unnamed protein product [Owenia fusiformis]|uniref:FMP27 C-terminal domain-containing protein n=1 Tax=Owenia fusiformis TaxID=6347 RepID=A0A8S4Q3X8_OWEFU|nr:unnamed protein product [Owenia fusiformis]
MSTIIWLPLVLLGILWLITRITAWVLCYIFRKYVNIEAKFGTIGLFTFKNVQFVLSNGTVLDIERLWLSSSFINNDAKKPIVLCISDVRLQTDTKRGLPSHKAQETKPKVPSSESPAQQVAKLSSVIQYVCVNIEHLHVDVFDVLYPGCQLNLSIQDISIDSHIELNKLQVSVSINTLQTKLLKPAREIGSPVPLGEGLTHQDAETMCFGEGSLSANVLLEIGYQTDVSAEVLHVAVTKLDIGITDELILVLHREKSRKRLDSFRKRLHSPKQVSEFEDALTGDDSEMQSKLLKILAISPKTMSICLENTKLRVTSSRNEDLSIAIRHVKLETYMHFLEKQLVGVSITLNIDGISAVTLQSTIFSLTKFTGKVQHEGGAINITSRSQSCQFTYNPSDLESLAAILNKIQNEAGNVQMDLRPKQKSHNQRDLVMQFIRNKIINIDVEIADSSVAVTTETSRGVVAGITTSKIKLAIMESLSDMATGSGDWFTTRDIRGDIDLEAIYMQLEESQVPIHQLNSDEHQWNTLLYIGLFIIKVNKFSSDVQTDFLMDGLHFEWSSLATSVAEQLITTISQSALTSSVMSSNENKQAVPSFKSSMESQIPETQLMCNINIGCTNINIFVSNEHKVCLMLRLDCVKMKKRQSQTTFELDGFKVVYLTQENQALSLVGASDLTDYVCHIQQCSLFYFPNTQSIQIQLSNELYFVWCTKVHMCIYHTLQDITQLKTTLSKCQTQLKGTTKCQTQQNENIQSHSNGETGSRSGNGAKIDDEEKEGVLSKLNVTVKIEANTLLGLEMTDGHRVEARTEEILITLQNGKCSIGGPAVSVIFDDNEIFKLKDVRVDWCYQPTGLGLLDLVTSKSFFPHSYNFSACFEQIINTWKWIKIVHKIRRKPFTVESLLPPDLIIKTKKLTVQLHDDPFEVKLGDNYELMVDEFGESQKRLLAMDKKIQELRKIHGLLPASKVDELYASLRKKNAEVYIKRSMQLYRNAPIRTKLFTWQMENVEIMAFADTSLHGKENCVKQMREIDKDT